MPIIISLTLFSQPIVKFFIDKWNIEKSHEWHKDQSYDECSQRSCKVHHIGNQDNGQKCYNWVNKAPYQ